MSGIVGIIIGLFVGIIVGFSLSAILAVSEFNKELDDKEQTDYLENYRKSKMSKKED